MKMKRFLASAICVACVIMLAIPTFARASSQIKITRLMQPQKLGRLKFIFMWRLRIQ